MHFATSLIALLGNIQFCKSALIPADQFYLGLSADQSHNGAFDHIKNSLKEASIIDGVVDDFTPKCYVLPFYGKHSRPVKLGNQMDPRDTEEKPTMKILCPNMNTTSGMSIVLTDPDAPSRKHPKWGEFCHWIAGVKSVRPEEFDVKFSDIVNYKPPAPPKKTGPHRYIFLLLEGVNTNLTAPEGRKRWGHKLAGSGVRQWAKDEGLEVIGANFFYAKYKK